MNDEGRRISNVGWFDNPSTSLRASFRSGQGSPQVANCGKRAGEQGSRGAEEQGCRGEKDVELRISNFGKEISDWELRGMSKGEKDFGFRISDCGSGTMNQGNDEGL